MVTQFSYAVRNVSHSSTPIFSAVAAVELVFLLVDTEPAGAAAFEFAGAAFLFVSAFVQESTKRPVKIHIIKRRDFDIGVVLPDPEWQSAPIIHPRPNNLYISVNFSWRPLQVEVSELHWRASSM